MTVFTPTDRPKSVRNHRVIEIFCSVVCVVLSLCPYDISVGVWAFFIEKLRLRNFHGSQVSFDFSTLYTSLPHDLVKAKVLSLGVSTESRKLTSVRQLRRDFSPTRNMTRMRVGLALSYVKLLLSS